MTDITTLSDRELLELAAAYCKIAVVPCENGWNESYPLGWNPLTDAGDRARACDEHGIAVIPWGSCVIAKVQNQSGKGYVFREEAYSLLPNRTTAANYAATRLMAIVQIEKENRK